jgi:hypothetical protein
MRRGSCARTVVRVWTVSGGSGGGSLIMGAIVAILAVLSIFTGRAFYGVGSTVIF